MNWLTLVQSLLHKQVPGLSTIYHSLGKESSGNQQERTFSTETSELDSVCPFPPPSRAKSSCGLLACIFLLNNHVHVLGFITTDICRKPQTLVGMQQSLVWFYSCFGKWLDFLYSSLKKSLILTGDFSQTNLPRNLIYWTQSRDKVTSKPIFNRYKLPNENADFL